MTHGIPPAPPKPKPPKKPKRCSESGQIAIIVFLFIVGCVIGAYMLYTWPLP